MLQAYPGRPNPVIEAIRGDLSARELRVMLEHLPRDNAAARELRGPWGDDQRLLHDISSQLRILRAETYNTWRGKGAEPVEPDFLPTPESAPKAQTVEDTEVIQAGRDHLQAVLGRPNPH